MKNIFRNYLTPNEQRILFLILAISFISILVANKSITSLYSNEVSPDSILADIEEPYELCVEVKTASKVELTQIKGIGPKTADKIIAFRDSINLMSNYDLLQVSGIGEKGLAKWIPFLKPLPNDSLYHKNDTSSIQNTLSTSQVNRIDINTATKEDFMLIKGIGTKKASQIITFIEAQNGIREMQELLSIKGIGKKTLAKIEEVFYIGLE